MGAVEFTEVICPSWIQENALSLGERSADVPGLGPWGDTWRG